MPSVVCPPSSDFPAFAAFPPVRRRSRGVGAVGEELIARSEGGVPDLRTGRAKKPMSSASDPSTGRGRLWTGNPLARSPGYTLGRPLPGLVHDRHDVAHDLC